VQRARAALIQEKRRDVEDLIGKSDLEGAARSSTARRTVSITRPESRPPRPPRRGPPCPRLQRFVGRYNKAMELAGRDPKAAIAILEELVATTSEPGQLEQAKKVLESLKAERR